MKVRVKSKFNDSRGTEYWIVQYKYKYFPFWLDYGANEMTYKHKKEQDAIDNAIKFKNLYYQNKNYKSITTEIF